ncbi:hypothetical protein EDC96DRAFT_548598 [Choanephora cucurbitarum]|nr:hypothetical protein EDC96DRAFT_548598 [Choanephora cucurbitarum]
MLQIASPSGFLPLASGLSTTQDMVRSMSYTNDAYEFCLSICRDIPIIHRNWQFPQSMFFVSVREQLAVVRAKFLCIAFGQETDVQYSQDLHIEAMYKLKTSPVLKGRFFFQSKRQADIRAINRVLSKRIQVLGRDVIAGFSDTIG